MSRTPLRRVSNTRGGVKTYAKERAVHEAARTSALLSCCASLLVPNSDPSLINNEAVKRANVALRKEATSKGWTIQRPGSHNGSASRFSIASGEAAGGTARVTPVPPQERILGSTPNPRGSRPVTAGTARTASSAGLSRRADRPCSALSHGTARVALPGSLIARRTRKEAASMGLARTRSGSYAPSTIPSTQPRAVLTNEKYGGTAEAMRAV